MDLLKLDSAPEFFERISTRAATRGPEPVETTSQNGLISFILVEPVPLGAAGSEIQKDLDLQRQYLIDLTGVATAYVQDKAREAKNPKLMYNDNLWEEVFSNLPMMAVPKFQRTQKNESLRGVEVATKFLALLTEMVVEGPVLAAFNGYLRGLGESIRAGVKSTGEAFNFGSIGLVLETQKLGNRTLVNGWLKGTFMSFTENDQVIYSDCASVNVYDMKLDFRQGETLFNYGALRPGSDVKTEFDEFLGNVQKAGIEKAKTFFKMTVKPKA